jgi:hypothetical protein
MLGFLTNELIQFTNELSFIYLGSPNRGHHNEQVISWSVVSVAAENREQLFSKWTSASVGIPCLWKPLLNIR